jgi:hypothetical protein
MRVEFFFVGEVFDAEFHDFLCGFGIREVKGGSAVEFDVLGRYVLANVEYFAGDVEDFHGEATGLGYAVLD